MYTLTDTQRALDLLYSLFMMSDAKISEDEQEMRDDGRFKFIENVVKDLPQGLWPGEWGVLTEESGYTGFKPGLDADGGPKDRAIEDEDDVIDALTRKLQDSCYNYSTPEKLLILLLCEELFATRLDKAIKKTALEVCRTKGNGGIYIEKKPSAPAVDHEVSIDWEYE